MTTDTKLNQLIINKLTQEQYDEAKAAGTLSDTELYITDSDDEALTNNNISNCITYIPQDIKLELNNGTLTLKAGSKVYIPNRFEADGTTPKFDVKIIESDIRVDSLYTDGPMFIYYVDNTVVPIPSSAQCSGTSNTIIDNYSCWYDTTNNIIKTTFGDEVGYSGMSLPLAIVNGASDGSWVSIDQVFNGFGYMGSTVFALPGVKGLIPNSRNADGSLKSIKFTTGRVLTYTRSGSATDVTNIAISKNSLSYHTFVYNDVLNTTTAPGFMNAGDIIYTSGKITSFTPKTVFHALDYNDKSTISGWSMPSGRFIDLTLGASGTDYTAPANGFFFAEKVAQATGQWLIFNTANMEQESIAVGAGNWVGGFVPVKKGMNCRISYTASGAVNYFRFIYAEGE